VNVASLSFHVQESSGKMNSARMKKDNGITSAQSVGVNTKSRIKEEIWRR